MSGANESTPGGGWKTNVLRLPGGVCVVEFTGDNPPAADLVVAPHVGHGSMLLWNNTDGASCSVYQNFGNAVTPNWTIQGTAISGAAIVAALSSGNKATIVDDGSGTKGFGGNRVNLPGTATGNNDFAPVANGRRVMGLVTVTEAFDDGDGSQPVFKIGDGTDDELFVAAAELTDAPVGTKIPFAGLLASGRPLRTKTTAGVGTTETGAISIQWLSGKDLD